MSEKEKRIIEVINSIIPQLSDINREKLLAFSEGMAFVKGKGEPDAEADQETGT